jgi:hypothetical protein
LPELTGRRLESEPDRGRHDGRCFQRRTYRYVKPDLREPITIRHLQNIPGERLPEYIFVDEQRALDGDYSEPE